MTTPAALHITGVATIVVPVSHQEQSLAFYTQVLGMAKVNDFTHATGERWLEVSTANAGANLCLVLARPEVLFWSRAPLAGIPAQFRLHDPDGNTFLVVAP